MLQKHQVRLLKDSALMDKMYEQNLLYFRELSMYILARKKQLSAVRNGKLKELSEKAGLSGLPEDAQKPGIWTVSVSVLRKSSMTWS